MDIKINQKFKELLPPLSAEEFSSLEESILAEGVRESIKLWQNQIIDGHNRFEICQKHDLPFASIDLHFADEDEVLDWIYTNQLGRRNLTANQRTLYIGQLYELRKKRVGAPEGSQNALKNNLDIMTKLNSEESEAIEGIQIKQSETASETAQIAQIEADFSPTETAANLDTLQIIEAEIAADIANLASEQAEIAADFSELIYEPDEFIQTPPKPTRKPQSTAQTIAKQFGVSEKTVRRAEEVAKAVEEKPELKKPFLSGKLSQKQVIEKAKESEPPPPKIPDTDTDDFTELAAKHGRRLHSLITELQEAVTAAHNEFFRKGQDFNAYGNIRRISLEPLKEMEWKTRILKTLKKCANCKAQKGGCEKCKQTGYQNKSDYSTTKSALSK